MAAKPPKRIEFHYVKSNNFHVVHCDGIWGGATPLGNITMSVYSERHPIPKKLTHELSPTGTLGNEIYRETKDGIIREVDVEIVFDLKTAQSMASWLQEHIQSLEKIVNATSKKDGVK